MAIGRISGPLLKSNLLREGVDLAFENDLLYLKVSPQVQGTSNSEDGDPNYPLGSMGPARGIGIKTNNPLYDLHVAGTTYSEHFNGITALIGYVDIGLNIVASTAGNLLLNPASATDRVVLGPAKIAQIYDDTNFNNSVTIADDLDVNGKLDVAETVEVGQTLTVTGESTFNDDVNINGNTTILGDTDVGGDLFVGTTTTYTSITAGLTGVIVTLSSSINIQTGTAVKFSSFTGLTGLVVANLYYVYSNNSVAKTFRIASSKANALAGTAITTATGTFSGSGTVIIGGTAKFENNVTVEKNLTVNGSLLLADSGNLVTVDGVQTLTNKTLTAPFINDGTINLDGGNLILPFSTTPSQTQNGAVVWDSDSYLLTIGNGTGRKTLVDTDSTQSLSNKSFASLNVTGVTDSSSSTTGAVTIAGGVGIAKKLYVGTDINSANINVTNEATIGTRIKFSTYAAIEYNLANDSIDFIFY